MALMVSAHLRDIKFCRKLEVFCVLNLVGIWYCYNWYVSKTLRRPAGTVDNHPWPTHVVLERECARAAAPPPVVLNPAVRREEQTTLELLSSRQKWSRIFQHKTVSPVDRDLRLAHKHLMAPIPVL